MTNNVDHRTQQLTDALADFYALDQQIKAALEKHVKPYRDQKKDIKSRLNENLNINASVFAAGYASYKLAAQAENDGDDATLGALRELFEASPIGSQVNMFAVDKPA